MLRMQEMTFRGFKNFLGEYTHRPPLIHAWYIGDTRDLQPLLSPSNILSHRKVPFQKMPPPPTGKSLKKALEHWNGGRHRGHVPPLFIRTKSALFVLKNGFW